MPGRELGTAQVSDLPRAHQIIESPERLKHIRPAVVAVHLEEVDVVRPETSQACLACPHDVVAGLTNGIDIVPHYILPLPRAKPLAPIPSHTPAEHPLPTPLQ